MISFSSFKNRQAIKMIFVIIFIAAFFFTCISNIAVAKEKGPDLLIWTHCQDEELAVIRKQAEQFGKENSIKTQVMNLPFYKFKKTFRLSATVGKGPDLIICPNDWIGDLVEEGLISPLNGMEIPPDIEKSFNKPGLDAMTYKGKVYGYPHLLETVAIIYNKKILDKEPKSMDELLEMASTYTTRHKGKYGFFFEVTNLYFSWPFLSGYGAEIFGKTNGYADPKQILLNSPNTLKGLEYLRSMRSKYKLIPDIATTDRMTNIFIKGDMLFCLNGPWMLQDLRKKKINYGVMPIPPLPNGKNPRPFVGVWGSLINKYCKNRNQAVRFMKYLNKPEHQKELCLATRRIPSCKETLKLISGEKDVVAFAKAASYGTALSNMPAMGHVWDPFSVVLKSVVLEGKKPGKVLKEQVNIIVENINKMME